MVTISRSGKPLTEKKLNDFEVEFKFKLPPEFKLFLLEYNGGEPDKDCFIFLNKDRPEGSSVRYFYPMGDFDVFKNTIESKIDIYTGRIPQNMLPIACDELGNLVLISDAGAVYFWDHELEMDFEVGVEGVHTNIHLVANSFNEFLAGLIDFDTYCDRLGLSV